MKTIGIIIIIIILMGMIIYNLLSPSNSIEGKDVLYTGVNGLGMVVTYVYISLDVIEITGLLEALNCAYNLICNASLQLNTQQDTVVTTFDEQEESNNNSATKVSSKEKVVGAIHPMSPFTVSNLYGSYPLNSEANLSKDPSGLMCCAPSLREANESGIGTLPTP